MRSLVETKIREEILYREALALGLEKGDTIVIRRLAQKMEFLGEDVSAVREPRVDELKSWFDKNRERFALPARVSFRHLYSHSTIAMSGPGMMLHGPWTRWPASLRTRPNW
jgi:peptidyl-prolyl cis-trans isomerase C